MKSSDDKANDLIFINDIPRVMNEGRGAYFVGSFHDVYPAIDERLTVGSEKGSQPWHADMERFFVPERDRVDIGDR